jgi:hypothetical protein
VTPDQFIAKWKAAELKERSAAQFHFIGLCWMNSRRQTWTRQSGCGGRRSVWMAGRYSEEDALAKLFALNQARATAQVAQGEL